MYCKNETCRPTPCEPGVTRRVMCYSDNLMMCEITFERGAQGNFHRHPHEQITYIAEGKFRFTIDGEECDVSKGDSVFMPSGSLHGVTCLEPGKLVDVFSPKRDEFLQ